MERTTTTSPRNPLPASPKVNLNQPAVTDDAVRTRAYEFYLTRGSRPGDEVGDWLRAERELRAN
jgi:hypothetical protein